jgi:hypothetical protein
MEAIVLNSIRNAALSAAVVLTSLAAAPFAQAAPISASPAYESGVIEVNHRRWHRPPARCNADRAVNKAWRMGLNRVRVTHVGSRTITVRGRWRGHSGRVIFARAPGCPVVARF